MMSLSLAFIVTGAVFGVRTHLFLQRAVPATGTIVKLMERRSDDGHVLYAPVFIFADTDGNTHKVFSSTASYPPIGDVETRLQCCTTQRIQVMQKKIDSLTFGGLLQSLLVSVHSISLFSGLS